MSDERWRLLEEAFAKVEPKDDADRDRLAGLKERLRVNSEASARDLARHYEEEAARKADHETTRRLAAERDAVAREARDALLAGLESQAGLIDRIAARRRP